jgi:hypothetical protein
VITDGTLTLSPLRLEDAATHFAGEDAELVRWLNGGPGTLAGVESYIRRTPPEAVDGHDQGFGTKTGESDTRTRRNTDHQGGLQV